MIDWSSYLLLVATGIVAGALNVVAGGGSFLSLPVLIFLGLHPGIANGTNRVAIWWQNAGAVWGFGRHRLLERGALLWAALPATAGAAGGTGLALVVDDQAFQRLLAFFMVAISLASLWSPRREGDTPAPTTPAKRLALASAFAVAGVYCGFVQAGAGFLLLAILSFAGLDLVRGNAVKVLVVLCATSLSLVLFALEGRVHWPLGLALALGNLVGGQIGVRLTVQKGHRWLRGVVTAMVVVFAVRLWLTS